MLSPLQELAIILKDVCDMEERIAPLRQKRLQAVSPEQSDDIATLQAELGRKMHYTAQLKATLRRLEQETEAVPCMATGLLADVGVQLAADEAGNTASCAFERFEAALYRKIADLAVRAGESDVAEACLAILEIERGLAAGFGGVVGVVAPGEAHEGAVDARLVQLRQSEQA
jgi:ferritin-like metal-binding protein YciE